MDASLFFGSLRKRIASCCLARDSESSSASKYIAAADTNTDGTVSAEEAAAYKKLLASAAEAKAQTQAQEYQKTREMSEQKDSSSFAVSA